MKTKHLSLIILGFWLASCAAQTGRIMPSVPPRPVTIIAAESPLAPYSPPVHRKTILHEVAPLETLWRISKMYDVSQDRIAQENGINFAAKLTTGEKLTIPDAAPIIPLVSLYPNDKWKFIVIHHTATNIGNAKLVDEWHLKRGFGNGLGYHFLIDNGSSGKQNGQIEISPRWIKQKEGAHTKGAMNKVGIGVSLVGNFSEGDPTDAQLDSLIFLVRELMNYYHIPASKVIGHRHATGAKTECPGTRFPWKDFKDQLQTRY